MSRGRRAARTLACALLLLASCLVVPPAQAQVYPQRGFAAGSLIIPMDIDVQDSGMLAAFGLVDALLRQGVPVWWCINPTKTYGTLSDVDFTATQVHDLQTSASVGPHGYRGGPFVVDAGDVSRAALIVHNWQLAHPAVKVHVADGTFITPYWQVMTTSPRIAVLASLKQAVAFDYLNAAGIPDENGLAWTGSSVDVLSPTAIGNGALLDATGSAKYNALLMPGWDIPGDATVRSAITAFLNQPVLVFAEDATAASMEGADLLTTGGLATAAPPATIQYGTGSYSPFFQMDARPALAFQPDPAGNAFLFPIVGDAFYDPSAEMLRGTGAATGHQDIWLAGFANGTCTNAQLGSCGNSGPKGRVAYLGGYYTTSLPLSTHPLTQGARLFLDALFAGTSTIAEAQPFLSTALGGPNLVTTPAVTVSVTLGNGAHVDAFDVTLADTLPPGAQFVSATNGGSYTGGVVTWLGSKLGYGESLGGFVTMNLPAPGSYTSSAGATFRAGNTPRLSTLSSTLQTQFNCPTPGLVAWWPAEGNANDITGNGHGGVLDNGATFAAGKVGTAFSLDGVNDNIAVPDSPALHFTNAMSVVGWINTTAGVDRYIATKHEDSFYFAVGGGSVAPHMLSFWLNGVSSSWFTGATPVDDGQWHHVAATYDGSTMSVYVDGHLDGSAPRTGTILAGASAVLIGARSDGSNASNFAGAIDELAMYDRAIGPSEVQALAAQRQPCEAVSVGDAPLAARSLDLAPPWPNPSAEGMNFEFRTPGDAPARAEIFDVAGRLVSRPLGDQLLPGGTHRFHWDGRDVTGARAAPGVYLVRVRSGAAIAAQRVVLVR